MQDDLRISTLWGFDLSVSRGSRQGGRGREKFLRKIPRNPLISLDSDERIQGNPSLSNPDKLPFPKQKAQPPRQTKSASPAFQI
jgi:hypothetical protein